MQYRPLRGLTTWTIALSIASFVLIVLVSLADLLGLLLVPTWSQPDAPLDGPLELTLIAIAGLGGLGAMAIGLAAAVVFFVWFAFANGNVPALGVMGKKTGPGWSVGWWFVPFANLVMPFRALKETYVGSQPGVNEVDRSSDATPAIVGWWWGLWLLNNLLSNIELRLAFNSSPQLVEAATYLGLVTLALSGVTLWLFVRWSLDITRWQQAKHDSGGAGMYACTKCGYDLRGTRGPFCPECGAEVPAGHLAKRGNDATSRSAAAMTREPWQT